MEADVTRFRDHGGPSAGEGKCQWIKRKMVKIIYQNFLKRSEHFNLKNHPYYPFLTIIS